jgi:beta-phosphoglucomutase-like phosphatase (HAD superfamily)
MSTTAFQSDVAPTIEAVLFDLDGVLTDTASLHESAWHMVFDELFARYPGARQLTHSDYQRYVQDLRRPGGFERVLASRGIHIPAGSHGDPADGETVASLAGHKERYFLQLLRHLGSHAFASSTTLLRGRPQTGRRHRGGYQQPVLR